MLNTGTFNLLYDWWDVSPLEGDGVWFFELSYLLMDSENPSRLKSWDSLNFRQFVVLYIFAHLLTTLEYMCTCWHFVGPMLLINSMQPVVLCDKRVFASKVYSIAINIPVFPYCHLTKFIKPIWLDGNNLKKLPNLSHTVFIFSRFL